MWVFRALWTQENKKIIKLFYQISYVISQIFPDQQQHIFNKVWRVIDKLGNVAKTMSKQTNINLASAYHWKVTSIAYEIYSIFKKIFGLLFLIVSAFL